MLKAVDIPNANSLLGGIPHKFTFKAYTVAEMHKAMIEVFKKAPPPKPFVMHGSEAGIKAINDLVWDIVFVKHEPCPSCAEMMNDAHCPYCDYPYNK